MSCQEEVPKKKARPLRRPAAPGALRCSVTTAAAQLAPAGLRQCSPNSPGLFALLGAPQGEPARQQCCRWRLILAAFRSCPLRRRAAQGATGRKGEDCLRGAAPSSAALPLRLSSAEHPAQPGDAAGATFLCLLSFGKTKESNAARQARKTARPQTRRISPIVRKNYVPSAPDSSNNPPRCVYGRMPVSARLL